MNRGRFITVEGGEGVGKSSFLRSMEKRLNAKHKLVVTYEPGGTVVADQLRKIFVNPPKGETLTIETEFLIVSAARAQHVSQRIKPALAQGSWVLCDRFVDSSRVYQGAIGGVPGDMLERTVAFSTYQLMPDLTFLLDCPVDVALNRLRKRAGDEVLSRYDEQCTGFHQQVRDGFLALAQLYSDRIVKLDASLSTDDMVDTAMQAIAARFGI